MSHRSALGWKEEHKGKTHKLITELSRAFKSIRLDSHTDLGKNLSYDYPRSTNDRRGSKRRSAQHEVADPVRGAPARNRLPNSGTLAPSSHRPLTTG